MGKGGEVVEEAGFGEEKVAEMVGTSLPMMEAETVVEETEGE